jgi:hypothetical protein
MCREPTISPTLYFSFGSATVVWLGYDPDPSYTYSKTPDAGRCTKGFSACFEQSACSQSQVRAPHPENTHSNTTELPAQH